MSTGSGTEVDLRAAMVRWGKSIFDRGLTAGSSGNISVKLDDGFLCTPTNSCLGALDADSISRLDASWSHIGGDRPTKEVPLHRAFYEKRASAGAVVHLHATYSTALSCLASIDAGDALPPITPYAVMRFGRVPVLPYRRPGSPDLGDLIAGVAERHNAVLLANHGPVVAGATLESAIFAMEELEETAKLWFLTRDNNPRLLDADQVDELRRLHPVK